MSFLKSPVIMSKMLRRQDRRPGNQTTAEVSALYNQKPDVGLGVKTLFEPADPLTAVVE